MVVPASAIVTTIVVAAVLISSPVRAETDPYSYPSPTANDPFTSGLSVAEHMARNGRIREVLEQCIYDLDIARYIEITPDGDSTSISVDIRNSTNYSITSLTIRPSGPGVDVIGFDGPTIIEFPAVLPGRSTRYSRSSPDLGEFFRRAERIPIIVADIETSSRIQLVGSALNSRFPFIDLDSLRTSMRELCIDA